MKRCWAARPCPRSGTWRAPGSRQRQACLRRLQGIHLRLPGCGEGGPTLEIFQYGPEAGRLTGAVNRPGYGHIAFVVDDVPTARKAVLAAGGSAVGETVTVQISGAGTITFAYLADPEGNVVELQHWDL